MDVELPHLFVYNNIKKMGDLMEYITIGKIINTFGIKGELKVYSSTDFASKRFKKKAKVSLYNEDTKMREEVVITSVRTGDEFIYIRLNDIEDINLVEKYKSYLIQVDKSSLHVLKNGTYYNFDLVGCKVYHQENYIGEVIRIESNGPQTLFRIQKEDKTTFLYPFVDIFVESVDVEKKIILINPIEGLLK